MDTVRDITLLFSDIFTFLEEYTSDMSEASSPARTKVVRILLLESYHI